MIAVEGVKMDAIQGLEVIGGNLRYIGGRRLEMNGLAVDIPETGYAYLGVGLVILAGMMRPCAVRLSGGGAERFGTLRIGEAEMRKVISEVERTGVDSIPFTFRFSQPRPRYSRN